MFGVTIYDKDLEMLGGVLDHSWKEILKHIAIYKNEAVVIDCYDHLEKKHIFNNTTF